MNMIRFGVGLGLASARRFSECIAIGRAAPNFNMSLRVGIFISDRPPLSYKHDAQASELAIGVHSLALHACIHDDVNSYCGKLLTLSY